MAAYYLNPDAVGLDDGSSEVNAWTTTQRAIDGSDGVQPSAGDIVFMLGLENTIVQIDFDGLSGGQSAAVMWVGVGPGWVEDGTRYVIDVGAAVNGIRIWGVNNVLMRNVELRSSSGLGLIGVYASSYAGAASCVFDNIYIRDFAGDGVNVGTSGAGFVFVNSKFRNNGGHGISGVATIIHCTSQDNAGSGFHVSGGASGSVYYGCLSANNGGDGYRHVGWSRPGIFFSSISDGNLGNGIYDAMSMSVAVGCRVTGNGVGMANGGSSSVAGYVYMPAPGEDRANAVNNSGVGELLEIYDKAGVATNVFSGVDIDAGYNDPVAGDYNLTSTAAVSNVLVDLDA